VGTSGHAINGIGRDVAVASSTGCTTTSALKVPPSPSILKSLNIGDAAPFWPYVSLPHLTQISETRAPKQSKSRSPCESRKVQKMHSKLTQPHDGKSQQDNNQCAGNRNNDHTRPDHVSSLTRKIVLYGNVNKSTALCCHFKQGKRRQVKGTTNRLPPLPTGWHELVNTSAMEPSE
jgi:hypothetical protein